MAIRNGPWKLPQELALTALPPDYSRERNRADDDDACDDLLDIAIHILDGHSVNHHAKEQHTDYGSRDVGHAFFECGHSQEDSRQTL